MAQQPSSDPRVVTVAELHARGLSSEPIAVREETLFGSIVEAFQQRPAVRTVAVVNARNEVVGVIPVRVLYEAMFLDVSPSAALVGATDFGAPLELVREMRHRIAGELMTEPVLLHLDDRESDAFTRIHRALMDDLPIVDADNRLVSYLDHVALAPLWIERASEAGAGE